MGFSQRFRFRNRVLPLILKYVQEAKLIQKYYTTIVSDRRKQIQDKLENSFLVAKGQIQANDQLLTQQLQQVEQDKKDNIIEKIIKYGRIYRGIKNAYNIVTSIREFFNKTNQQVDWDTFNESQHYRNTVRRDFQKRFLYQEQAFTDMMVSIFAPIGYMLYQQFEEAMQKMQSQLWWYICKNILFPDWSDPIDVCIWAVAMIGTVGTAFFGLGAPVAVAAWGARFYKAYKIIGRIEKTVKAVKRARKLALNSRGYKASRAILNGAVAARSRKVWIDRFVTVLDFIHVDEGDVKELRRKVSKKTVKWGQKTQNKIAASLYKAQQAANELISAGGDAETFVATKMASNTFLRSLQVKRRGSIQFQGLQNIECITILDKIAKFFSDLYLEMMGVANKERDTRNFQSIAKNTAQKHLASFVDTLKHFILNKLSDKQYFYFVQQGGKSALFPSLEERKNYAGDKEYGLNTKVYEMLDIRTHYFGEERGNVVGGFDPRKSMQYKEKYELYSHKNEANIYGLNIVYKNGLPYAIRGAIDFKLGYDETLGSDFYYYVYKNGIYTNNNGIIKIDNGNKLFINQELLLQKLIIGKEIDFSKMKNTRKEILEKQKATNNCIDLMIKTVDEE